MATLYSNIATVQVDGANFPANYNEPVMELGSVNRLTAIYTITGAELANDVINVCKIPVGSLVAVNSSVASNGVSATTSNIKVGDTDTIGGTVSADPKRYSDTLEVHAAVTSPTQFAGGSALFAPAVIVDDSVWLTATIGTIAGALTVGGKLVFRVEVICNR